MKFYIVENHDHTYSTVIVDGNDLGIVSPFTASWYAGAIALAFKGTVKERNCSFGELERFSHFETGSGDFAKWQKANRVRAVREVDDSYQLMWKKDIKKAVDEAYKEGQADSFRIDDFTDSNAVVSDELKNLEIARKQEAIRKLNEERTKAK